MRIMIEEQLIATALRETVDAILNGIDDLVAHLAPDVAIDVAEHGMLLCGGAAQLLGLAAAMSARTKMPARVVDDPTTCAARGARLLAHQELPVELMRA